MRIHFAGAEGVRQWQELLHAHNVKNRLQSYHWLTKSKKAPDNFDVLLMDSGGFTARNRGIQISVETYTEFLNKYEIQYAFELDTNDIKETLANREYLCLNAKHSKIIPIYHYSEYENRDKKYLFDILDNFDYISVGGIVGRGLSDAEEARFFDFFFHHVGTKWKVHGLGVTNTRHLNRYPFFSVDSTSWLGPGRFGNFKCIRDQKFSTFLAAERDCYTNVAREIKYWLRVQETVTNNWKYKGVIWEQ